MPRSLPPVWKGPSGPIPTRAELGLDNRDHAPGTPTGLLSSILNSTADGLLVIDRGGRILAWNDMFVSMWNIPLGVMESRRDDEALAAVLDQVVDAEAFLGRIRELYSHPEEESFETISLKNGRIFERFSRPLGPMRDIQGRVWSFRDATIRRMAERSLRESEMRFRAFAEGAACALLIYRGEEIVFANRWAIDAFGDVLGKPYWVCVHPDDVEIVKARGRARSRRETVEGHYDVRLIDREGRLRWFEVTGSTIELDGQAAVLTTAYDITKRKEAEDHTRHVAFHDALTDLPNRALFTDRAEAALTLARRESGQVGVILLDVDRFKNVNDSLGHDAGDELIKRSADRLREVLRGSDTVARLGGDEFAILLPGLKSEETVRVARKLLEAMRQPFLVAGRELRVSASLGLAIGPQDGENVQTLLKSADTAMYRAKDAGRDRLQLFDATMNRAAIQLLELENELHEGLAHNEFALYYQPIVRAVTGELCGVEALIRWRRPDGTVREPDDFIPVAEATGLIQPLGLFVLQAACRDIALMRATLGTPLRVSVNISAAQMREPNIVGIVSNALRAASLDAGSLELEITESSALQGQERTLEALRELVAMGVAISLDDFGTGYASLDLLRRLPIKRIKIDRTFVQDVGSDRVDEAIASATIALAHQLSLEVVGEGVETEFQRHFLESHGCDLLQGHLLGRPMPRDEMTRSLQGRRTEEGVVS
ncbi:MAG: EAL domain-containing protein [Vicinamibacteria bacterium]|nr:EAL domain-containing protein [Vicinamibacteria bacterium]